MSTTKIPLNWLRAFEVAARHLSLSAAAEELHITPAAISQQVRLLEHYLGAPLFVRHARGLRLTPAGESLLPACRESFGRLEGVIAEQFGRRGPNRLVVRVALGFAREWLLDRVARFSAQHPDLQLRIIASVWTREPVDDTVDVDIRLDSGPLPARESHALTRDELFPVCSPELLRRSPRLRRLDQLGSQTLLSTIGFAEGWNQWLQRANLSTMATQSRIEFDSMRLALETAALGHGVALARTSYARDLLKSGQLRRLFAVSLPTSDNIYLTHARGLESGAPAAVFRDWILASVPIQWRCSTKPPER